MSDTLFCHCEICGSSEWKLVRTAAVRDGVFGQSTGNDAVVGKCAGCNVERLAESFCQDESIYTSVEYRQLLAQGDDAASFFAEHDHLQLQKLSVLWPQSVRNKIVADIGCGAGSFLDHVSGLASKTIAIEPCEEYHDSLRERGHIVYAGTESAKLVDADYAFSFSVIEHVGNPRLFLASIAEMLAKNGRLLVSTPNRRDLLMEILPEAYPAFFYRTVHRWYFDEESFTRCAELAGLRVDECNYVHRFGISNAMAWLRDRKPTGESVMTQLDNPVLDNGWRSHLEQTGTADYLYFWLTRA